MTRQYHDGFFSNSKAIWGLIIIGVGVLLLLQKFNYIDIGEFIGNYWPVLLILWGLGLVFKRGHREEPSAISMGDKNLVIDDDEPNHSNVFGDVEVKIETQNFRGGKMHTVFGDVEVDLADMNITSGEKNLYLSGVFGDIDVAVPRNLPFKVKANLVAGEISLMGQKRSGFSIQDTYRSAGYESAVNRLNISISHVFGEIKVR